MNQPDLSRLRIERDARPEARPRGRGPLWLVALAILAAVVAGWFLLRPRETAVEMAVISATGGGTSTGSGITANGYVVARTKASVSAEVLGRLEYLSVSEGSRVTRGQVIARIESGRTREIAVLLTLGFTPGAVMLSFMIESVLLALIGGALGCLLALPVNGITTSTTNWASFSEVAFAFRVTPEGLAAGLIFAAVMGLAGGFFPARRAAKQTLASSLRGV